MKFKRIIPTLAVLFLSLNSLLKAEITDEQKLMLDALPPDQRSSVITKMESANELEGSLEEIFKNEQNLVERPDYQGLKDLQKSQNEECIQCIFGYDFFKYAPTTFAPVNNVPIGSDYILGPGDKLLVNLYGNTNNKFESFVSRDGNFFLPPLGLLMLWA